MLRILAKIGLAILLPVLALGAIMGRNADSVAPVARSADEALSSGGLYSKAFPSEFDGLDENALVRAIQKADDYKIRDIAGWYDKLVEQPDRDRDRIIRDRVAEIVRFDTSAKGSFDGAYILPPRFRDSKSNALLMIEGTGRQTAITYFGAAASRYVEGTGLEWLPLGSESRTSFGTPMVAISESDGAVIMVRGTAMVGSHAICFDIAQAHILIDREHLPLPSMVRPIRLVFDGIAQVGPLCQTFYGVTDTSLRSALFRPSDRSKLVGSDEGPHRVEFVANDALADFDVPAADAALLRTFLD